jgi:outer membrane protein OmpA-like peptidoglycan-associated protein
LFKLLIVTESIGVEIEHQHYALFLDLRKDVQNELALTTISDNQKKAAIKVYLFSEGKKIPVKEIVISPLPPKPAGEIKITLKGRLEKKRHLRLAVLFGKKQVHTSSTDLNKYRNKRSLWWIPVLLFVILGAAAGVVFGTGITGRQAETADAAVENGKEGSVASKEKTSKTVKTGEKQTVQETEADEAEEKKAPEAAEDEATTEAPLAKAAEDEATTETPETAKTAVEEPSPEIPAETIQRTVYFQPESASLTRETRSALLQVLELLNRYKDAKVEIIGHCALFPTEIERKALSLERAEAVYTFLVTNGWKPEIPPDMRGLGGDSPAASGEHRQHLNRRVEVVIRGKEE